ncbi:hypothetical protein BYT27DRAFT_7253194 [Phlegmacium glaucopus]|nr:hypothetical protein BYT27DRAFT_7253194 [Phlegmacium glaucopus]
MHHNSNLCRVRSKHPVPVASPTDGTDSGQGSGPLSDAFIAQRETHPLPGGSRRIAAPSNISCLEVRRSLRVASRGQSVQTATLPTTFIVAPPGTRPTVGYVYEFLPSIANPSPSVHEHAGGPSDQPGNRDDSRGIPIPQSSLEPTEANFTGCKCSATNDAPGSPRIIHHPTLPNPTTPAHSGHSHLSVAPILSPINSNPLLHHPPDDRMHTPSPGRKTTSLCTRDANAAWAAAEGLLPISEAFRTPGYAPAHIVGGITYDVCSSRSAHPGPASPAFARQLFAEHHGSTQFVPHGLQCHPSERSHQRESHITPENASSQPRRLASRSHFHDPLDVPAIGEAHQARAPESHPHGSGPHPPVSAPHASNGMCISNPALSLSASHLQELTRQCLDQHRATSRSHPNLSPPMHHLTSPRPHPDVHPDILAAISAALGSAIPNITLNAGPSQPGRKFFSHTITNTTSELLLSVIKELKNGFKSYIPISLCTHKACSNATQSTDAFDTEIGMNERGEIRLKQKTFTAAKDHSITTDDFTEIRENFTRGMRKYLILGDNVLPAG